MLNGTASPPTLRQFKIARSYVGIALILFNTLVLFVLLNLVVWLYMVVRHRNDRPDYLASHSDAWYRKVYAPMSDTEWKQLLMENKTRRYSFQPYVMFTEPPFHGKYVNVSDNGYRLVPNQGPWPMDPKNYNVLALGNSTTFGYDVADDQTVPAYMQAILQEKKTQRVCVYNFGRRGFFSTQERILFEQLLQEGIKPNLVVFLDGLNDFLALDPSFHPLAPPDSINPLTRGAHLLALLQSLPVGQMAQHLSHKFMAPKAAPLPDCAAADLTAINQYAWNKRAIESIASAEGIATVFVFQPAPIYEYDLTDHEPPSIKGYHLYGDQCAVQGYPLMTQYVKDNKMGDDFLWLVDIQLGIHKNLYVDKWHYNPEFARTIAGDICKFVEDKKDIAAAK